MRKGALIVVGLFAVACAKAPPVGVAATPTAPGTPSSAESAAPVESNPPGDIPDTQAFVEYRSASGGYHLQVPEGWARTERGASVAFADKLHALSVDVESASGPRTVDQVRSVDEPKIRSSARAFQEVAVQSVTLASGPAVLLRYRANSTPNQVTGKVYRLEVDRYELYRNGKLAALSLSAPAGSDNVDVWKQISNSFGWSA